MKTCILNGCENKHHGKGYCKYHYNVYILAPRLSNLECTVDGCTKPVSISFSGKKLCEMHGTRLRRHGNVNDRTRAREIKSLLDIFTKIDDPLEFEFPNRSTWALVSKAYYGEACMRCGWGQGTCDVHHKVPYRKGGKSSLNNAEVICPNCHRLEHQYKSNYISIETKSKILEVIIEFKERNKLR